MPNAILLSTWSFGQRANRIAWPVLIHPGGGEAGGGSLDAVESACGAAEDDPAVTTVGYGGFPDAGGTVSLDASIMLSPDRCGAVAAVRHYKHPVTIARLVMERTGHVMLVGEGAEQLAALHGLAKTNLLTDRARRAYDQWLAEHPDEAAQRLHVQRSNFEESSLPPEVTHPKGAVTDVNNQESLPHNRHHDTIGCLALDPSGTLAGGCTTSGLAFKRPGRVGDSPIVGHGLYVDPEHGAAVATGTGELVMGISATFLAVETLRNGASPRDAVSAVLQRAAETYSLKDEHQIGLIVLTPDGQWSHGSLRPGYRTAVKTDRLDKMVEPDVVLLT